MDKSNYVSLFNLKGAMLARLAFLIMPVMEKSDSTGTDDASDSPATHDALQVLI